MDESRWLPFSGERDVRYRTWYAGWTVRRHVEVDGELVCLDCFTTGPCCPALRRAIRVLLDSTQA